MRACKILAYFLKQILFLFYDFIPDLSNFDRHDIDDSYIFRSSVFDLAAIFNICSFLGAF